MVQPARLCGEFTAREELVDGLRGQLAADHAGVDPLAREGIGLARGISHRHELPGRAPLDAAQAQRRDSQALPELHAGPESALDEGIVPDLVLVEIDQSIGAHGAAGNRVAAEVDVVVVVTKERDVARQHVLRVEEHAARLEVVGAALHVLPAGHPRGRGRHHAERTRDLARGPVGGHQHPGAEAPAIVAAHGPEAVGLELRRGDRGVLEEIRTDLGRPARDALVADDALDGVAARAGDRFALLDAHVALARRRDEAPRGGVANQSLGLELLEDPHLLEDVERRSAPGIPAVLVPREGGLLEQRNPPAGPLLHPPGEVVGGGGPGRPRAHHDHVVGGSALLAAGMGIHAIAPHEVDRPIPSAARSASGSSRSGPIPAAAREGKPRADDRTARVPSHCMPSRISVTSAHPRPRLSDTTLGC